MVIDGLRMLSSPSLIVALLVFGLVTLELERAWTRARRRANAYPGALAYLLDGLVVLSVVASIAMFVARLGSAWMSGGVRPLAGLAAIGAITIATVALVRRRAGQPGQATASADGGAEEPVAAPAMPVQSDPDEPASELLLYQKRRARVALAHPRSFLDLAAPAAAPEARPKRRRGALVAALIVLVATGALAGGALLFRQQATDLLSRARQIALRVAAASGTAPPEPAAGLSAIGARATAPPATPAQTIMQVKSASLNLRAEPGTDQPVVLVLAKGEAVTLLNETRIVRQSAWVKVRVGDRVGWVSRTLLE